MSTKVQKEMENKYNHEEAIRNEKNRPIVKDLRKIRELNIHFNEVIGECDDKEDWEYSDSYITSEVKYVKSQYEDWGWDYADILAGVYGSDEERKAIRKELNKIKRFLKKWENK